LPIGLAQLLPLRARIADDAVGLEPPCPLARRDRDGVLAGLRLRHRDRRQIRRGSGKIAPDDRANAAI